MLNCLALSSGLTSVVEFSGDLWADPTHTVPNMRQMSYITDTERNISRTEMDFDKNYHAAPASLD